MKKSFFKIISIIIVVMMLCSIVPITASSVTRIPVVSITGIDTPVEGGYGDYIVTLGHPTYELVEVNDNEYVEGVKWSDENGKSMVPGIDRFAAGVKYTVTVNVISKYSYIFQPLSCTINNEEANWVGDNRIVQLSKTFEATADSPDVHTIKFDYGFDGIVEYEFCNDGDAPPIPEYRQNGDLAFYDWYEDKEFTKPFDFNADVYENKTLYARYVDPNDIVSVYMYTTDNDFPYNINDAVIGDILSVEDPYVEGMFFTEWYGDPDRVYQYDFSQPITGDVYLYARMISYDDVATVYTYMPDEYFYTDAYEVEKGRCVDISDPVADGMYFAGWYRDKEYTKPFYMNQPVTDDIAIYARFVPLSEMHTVSLYYEDDTTPVATFLIEDGHCYFMVEEPSVEGKVFFGLFTNPERTIPFSSFQPITEDTSIYAKFVAEEDLRKVSVYIDGNNLYSTEMVEKGTYYSRPEPSMEGKTFFGWYSDPERLNEFDFSQPITEDVSIYARFVADEDICYVDIYLEGDTPIASGMVEKGTCYSIEDPGQENMVFVGWYSEPERINKFDFSQPIIENTAIYAKFVPSRLLGDANQDGVVDVSDATTIQKHLASLITLDETASIFADVDSSGDVSIIDATLIQKYLAGINTQYPIGQPVGA